MSSKLLYLALVLCGLIAIRNYQWTYRVNRFNEYLIKFSKNYSDSEFHMRMLIFEESLKEIDHLNSKSHGTGASHGLTKFSDLSAEERPLNPMAGGCVNRSWSCTEEPMRSVTKLPVGGKLDWRDEGVIGPVLDQKMCNGCWAFSIVGVMESMAAIQGLGFTQLSIQELLDCSDITAHCSGGNIMGALKLLCVRRLKITTEDKYPLLLVNRTCQWLPNSGKRVGNYTGHCDANDEYIKDLLSHGPVMAVINPSSLYSYVEGIITMNCPPIAYKIFHVVQIVGYDTTTDDDGDDVEYYIIRNSWGTDWGEDGYMRIAMGKNLCGINNYLASLYVLTA